MPVPAGLAEGQITRNTGLTPQRSPAPPPLSASLQKGGKEQEHNNTGCVMQVTARAARAPRFRRGLHVSVRTSVRSGQHSHVPAAGQTQPTRAHEVLS